MLVRLPRSRFRPRLYVIIRRLILIAASALIAYYVLSTFFKSLAPEDRLQESEQSRPPNTGEGMLQYGPSHPTIK
jgi:hypothetical protein